MCSLFGLNALNPCPYLHRLLSGIEYGDLYEIDFFFFLYWIYSVAETLNIWINEHVPTERGGKRTSQEWGSATPFADGQGPVSPVFHMPLFTVQDLAKWLHWLSDCIKKQNKTKHSFCKTHAREKIAAKRNTRALEMIPCVSMWAHPKFKLCFFKTFIY